MSKQFGVCQAREKKDTLIIIGNGFDIWQGFQTGYPEFWKYYYAHQDEIMKRLRIRKRYIKKEDGESVWHGDVELIYGNPFNPEEPEEEFWNRFEVSLDKMDSERSILRLDFYDCGSVI